MATTELPLSYATLLILSSFIVFLLKTWRRKPKTLKNLPPSPWKLPVIGHLHHLVGDLPHKAFKHISKSHGAVMLLQTGEVSTVVISSREAAKEVLKDEDPACADRPENVAIKIIWYDYSDLAFAPYGEYWRQMRKICILEMLSSKNVRSFGDIRQDEISRLMDLLQSSCGRAVNLTEEISTFTGSLVCRMAFGSAVQDLGPLIDMFKAVLNMATGFMLADAFPSWKLLHIFSFNKYRLLRIRGKLDAVLDRIVEEHTVKRSGEFGGEDVVDVLLRIQRNGELQFPITTKNIKAVILDLFVAGSETSSTTLIWAISELMKNPRVMEKAETEVREAFKGKEQIEEKDVEELKYMKLVIKETLRLHPAVPLVQRQCREECKAGGYNIPVKARVLINLWSIGRDPLYWDDPEEFRPERFEKNPKDYLGNQGFEYIPFGAGRRICPGMHMGLINVELPLAKMLYHFDWKAGDPNSVDLTEGGGLVAPRKHPLLLVPTLRNPL